MATTYRNIIQSKIAEVSITKQYTTATSKAIVDKFTALNIGSIEATIDIYIVKASETPNNSNKIISSKAISPNQTISIHELVGHVIEAGGSIYTSASSTPSISIRASGREIA